jgi:hypothetical protein
MDTGIDQRAGTVKQSVVDLSCQTIFCRARSPVPPSAIV